MSITRRYTIADLEQMTPAEGERYELIDGELYVAKQPSGDHQYAADELQAALRSWSHTSRLGMSFTAPGLVFDQENGAAPDVIWISRQRLSGGTDDAGHFVVGPELVVEVLSPGAANVRRDRETKMALYAREGVDEYWIVDCSRQCVEVYRRSSSGLALVHVLAGDDLLESPHLPGFNLAVASLWVPPWLPGLRDDTERA